VDRQQLHAADTAGVVGTRTSSAWPSAIEPRAPTSTPRFSQLGQHRVLARRSLTGTNTGNMFRLGNSFCCSPRPNWGFGTDPTVDRGCTMFQITADPPAASTLAHAATADQPATSCGIQVGQRGRHASGRRLRWRLSGRAQLRTAHLGDLLRADRGQRHSQSDDAAAASRRHVRPAPQVWPRASRTSRCPSPATRARSATTNLTATQWHARRREPTTPPQSDEWWNNVPNDTCPHQHQWLLQSAHRRALDPGGAHADARRSDRHRRDRQRAHGRRRPSLLAPARRTSYRRRVLTTTVYPRNNKPL
jgi:hypothetical protein